MMFKMIFWFKKVGEGLGSSWHQTSFTFLHPDQVGYLSDLNTYDKMQNILSDTEGRLTNMYAHKRTPLIPKPFSFGHCQNYLSPPSPQFGQIVPLFFYVKNDVLARITETSNDDYDNRVSDNCDHNFGTFDDFWC